MSLLLDLPLTKAITYTASSELRLPTEGGKTERKTTSLLLLKGGLSTKFVSHSAPQMQHLR